MKALMIKIHLFLCKKSLKNENEDFRKYNIFPLLYLESLKKAEFRQKIASLTAKFIVKMQQDKKH